MEITTKAQYTETMSRIAAGEKLDPKTFDSLKAFAKAKKVKQPDPAARLDKAPAKKGRPKAVEVECKAKDCEKIARVHGLCVAHDAAERRKDPVVREKTREEHDEPEAYPAPPSLAGVAGELLEMILRDPSWTVGDLTHEQAVAAILRKYPILGQPQPL